MVHTCNYLISDNLKPFSAEISSFFHVSWVLLCELVQKKKLFSWPWSQMLLKNPVFTRIWRPYRIKLARWEMRNLGDFEFFFFFHFEHFISSSFRFFPSGTWNAVWNRCCLAEATPESATESGGGGSKRRTLLVLVCKLRISPCLKNEKERNKIDNFKTIYMSLSNVCSCININKFILFIII